MGMGRMGAGVAEARSHELIRGGYGLFFSVWPPLADTGGNACTNKVKIFAGRDNSFMAQAGKGSRG